MAFTVQLAIEGVLASEDDQGGLATSHTIPEGLLLFYALASQFHVVLSTLSVTPEVPKRFLHEAGVRPTDYARLLLALPGASDLDARVRHFSVARAQGWDLRYVIDPDPEVAKAALARGICPLCCPHPRYSRPSFLPNAGQGGLSWEAIVAEQKGQGAIRAADDRVLADDIEEPL